jgi:hypothetical protein
MMAKLHEHRSNNNNKQTNKKEEAINPPPPPPPPKKELTSEVGNIIVNELHFIDEIKL